MKNKIALIPLIFLCIFLQGCTSLLRLRNSPSEAVLISVKSIYNPVSYNFTSNVKEQLEYKQFIIPINKAMKNNIDTYMKIKFTKLSMDTGLANNDYFIEYNLKQLDLDMENQTDGLGTVMSILNSKQNVKTSDVMVSSNINLTVKVYKNKNLVGEKNFFISSVGADEVYSNGGFNTGHNAYELSINESMSKTIILVDRYLTELGLN